MKIDGSDPFKGVMMERIKTTRNCNASGKSLAAGQVYKVPADVSADDAKVLISMGKAVPAGGSPKPENREKDLEAATSKRGKAEEKGSK